MLVLKAKESKIQKETNSRLQRELCVILRKRFSIKLAIDIQQFLVIKDLTNKKIGICFKKDLHLTHYQKELLRESLYSVYGQNIEIVSLPKLQAVKSTVQAINQAPQSTTKENTVLSPIMPEPATEWQKVRKHLVEIYGEDLVSVSFVKLDISETKRQIIFTGSDTFTEMVENKFGANLDWLAKEYGISFVFVGKSKAFKGLVISEIN